MKVRCATGTVLLAMACGAMAGARIESFRVESREPGIPGRDVRVWLPPDYDESGRRYPVIYFHDGQNVFRPGGPFGCWFAEEAAAGEMAAGRMREAIIVAVPNNEAEAGLTRVTEYQPPGDVNPRDPAGREGVCDRYGRYLAGEVKRAVDARYRTLPDRANTVVAGSSMGGLVSLWLGLHTDAFGAAGVFSPAFWTSPEFMKSVMEGQRRPGLRIYLDMGTRERGNTRGDYWQDALLVRDALLRQGYAEGSDFLWNPGEGDEHNEVAWAKRLPAALRFLLPPEAAGSPAKTP